MLPSCASTSIIAIAGGYEDSDFLSSSPNLGIKSGRKKFDMVPERPAGFLTIRFCVAHSSRGLGHLPLKEEITGSNPVCATKIIEAGF